VRTIGVIACQVSYSIFRAETVVATWKDMLIRSESIYKSLPSETKPAYFQLVHHPIQASSIVQELYYTVGMWETLAMEVVDVNLTERRQEQPLRVTSEA
jgi:hypothetical protein